MTAVLAAASLLANSLSGQVEGEHASESSETEFEATGSHSRLGADSCMLCHNQGTQLDASGIFATPHAALTDPAAPFANMQCESCHGPGKDHARSQRGGGAVLPPVVFGISSETSARQQNGVCLDCHENRGPLDWFGSMHEEQEIPCAACHRIHRESDPVFDPLAQQQTCFACHKNREADVQRSSNHPLRFGEMSCGDCHDPHAGNNDFLLREATVNQTCYTCHTEKRGPFLWEHAPASEDCSLCHRPHGSNHDAMLTKRPPLLCQQCHASAGHPGMAFTPDQSGNEFSNRFMLGRSCVNCHSSPHGSNHPSGVILN